MKSIAQAFGLLIVVCIAFEVAVPTGGKEYVMEFLKNSWYIGIGLFLAYEIFFKNP